MARDLYEIRTMTRAELDIAVEWAAIEGWNPGLNDAECFYRTDPSGFFIGLLDGEPVGSISAVVYGPSYGFLGLYIVKPEYRGRGFGIQLWQRGMAHLSGVNVGLDGVVEQQGNYKKSGFEPAYRNIRYQWQSGPGKPATAEVTQLSDVPMGLLLEYDEELFGVKRSRFLDCWIDGPWSTGRAVIRDRRILGYGIVRKCRDGFKIGPLFADDGDLADALFVSLTADLAQGTPVFLDVPEVNPQAVRIAQKYGMTKVFETARMYIGEPPDVPLDRWFGVTTFELG